MSYSITATSRTETPARPQSIGQLSRSLSVMGAWILALLWITPLLYAMWAAFHPSEFATKWVLNAPVTFGNFVAAWDAAPFARYFLNTTILVTGILCIQLIVCTLAAYAFARYAFFGKNVLFSLVLIQLMVMPEILIVRNYQTLTQLGLVDTLFGIGLPYFASAFAIFLLRQTFKTIPSELVEAAVMEGASQMQILRHVYIPLAKPVYLAFALVSISYHWNNFLWPLVVSNSVGSRPLTVGLQVFSSSDQGIDWSIITAATLLTSAPLLIGFLIFQKQFVQSFMRAGIK